jgi:hypothetical protein
LVNKQDNANTLATIANQAGFSDIGKQIDTLENKLEAFK